MTGREQVEQAIRDEEAFVERVARLLESKAELAAWPEDLHVALALALEDDAMSRTESWKAVALRRHLFGGAGMVPDSLAVPRQPSLVDHMRAERLRAALPARLRYRGATYLLPASA
jgi:hypothetical protein